MLGFREHGKEGVEGVGHVCPCVEVSGNQELNLLVSVGDALGCGLEAAASAASINCPPFLKSRRSGRSKLVRPNPSTKAT